MFDLERAREALRPEADEARVQRVWTEVARRRRAPQASSRRRTVALVALACLTLLGFVGSAVWETVAPDERAEIPRELRLADDAPLPPRLRGEVRLSDASRVVVEESARLDVLANDPRALGLALRRGRARFEVTPGGPRSWNVDAGAVSVQVVGTVFEVARSREGVTVSVEHGAVLVRGASVPDRVQRLEAGQRLFVPSDVATPSPVATASTETRVPNGAQGGAEDGAHDESPSTREAAWRAELAQRRYVRAFEALGADGHARETRRARDVAALWELADVARFSGHPSEAAVPLRRLVEEHPNDPRAALAAYTLGRLELDSLGAPHAAAESFARSEALGLPEALREAAAASHVEALGRAGRRDDARGAAERYLARHPEGARRVQVERWLAP
jgi:transmembrane sensor